VSGRLLLQYTPVGIVVPQQIDSNITRVIDVKGDTTIWITIPWINETDFRTCTPDGVGLDPGPGIISISVYNQIISSDASSDANIDLVVWSSAAPDCQFSNPVYTGTFAKALAPERKHQIRNKPRRFKAQCDIQQDFQRTFPPLVEGCSIHTDQHYVVSEVSDRVIDNLKRYVTAQQAGSGPDNVAVYSDFTPQLETVSWAIDQAFVFRRGGVLYRVYQDAPTVNQNFRSIVKYQVPLVSPAADYAGQAAFSSSQRDSLSQFAVPWFNEVAFLPQSVGSNGGANYSVVIPAMVIQPDLTLLTAVRDDYELGWLVRPNLTLPPQKKKKIIPASQPPKPPPKVTVGRPAATSLGVFTGL